MADKERKLTHEDRIIWEKVARTVRRYSGKDLPADPDLTAALALVMDDAPRATAESGQPGLSGLSPSPVRPKPEQRLHPIDKPVKRKLAKGHLAIDGRIDLHGLTQSEAHNLLFDFLVRAHQRGLRHVLVITGKGSSMGSQGVLKRAVPVWLAKPEFRFLVSGHEDAARTHGGDGAMYIRLRRQRDKPE